MDRDAFIRRLGGLELAMRMATRFIDYYHGPLGELTAAVQQKDGSEVRRLAHSLKGSLSYFEVEPLGCDLGALQDAGEREAWDHAERLLAEVSKQLAEFAETLRSWTAPSMEAEA